MDGLGGLGAAVEPVADALLVEDDRRRVGLGVVTADRLDDAAISGGSTVGDDDYGQIIGRGGRTAQALRTVVKAAAVKDNRRVLVDIVE